MQVRPDGGGRAAKARAGGSGPSRSTAAPPREAAPEALAPPLGTAAPRGLHGVEPETSWEENGADGSLARAPWQVSGRSPWRLTPRAKLVTFWACLALAIFFLWAVRSVLRPFVVALILAYVLNPIVARVSQRARLPRALSVSGIYVVLAMTLTWVGLVVFPVTMREARDLAATLPRLLVQAQNSLAAQQTISVFGAEVSLAPLSDELARTLAGFVSTASHSLVETAVSTVETLIKSVLTLVATFYLLMAADQLKEGVRTVTPPRFRQEFGPLVGEIDRILGRFVRGELLLIIIMSFATWLTLSILGIRYALLLGIVAGVLELIPFVGPIMAAIPAVALAIFQPSPFGWSPLVNAGVVALAFFVLRHSEDYFVIPQVVGRAVDLHPLVAMLAVFSGAALYGVLGMFLGVPVAAVLRVLIRYMYGKLTEEPT